MFLADVCNDSSFQNESRRTVMPGAIRATSRTNRTPKTEMRQGNEVESRGGYVFMGRQSRYSSKSIGGYPTTFECAGEL